jgi:hypothetical protein
MANKFLSGKNIHAEKRNTNGKRALTSIHTFIIAIQSKKSATSTLPSKSSSPQSPTNVCSTVKKKKKT